MSASCMKGYRNFERSGRFLLLDLREILKRRVKEYYVTRTKAVGVNGIRYLSHFYKRRNKLIENSRFLTDSYKRATPNYTKFEDFFMRIYRSGLYPISVKFSAMYPYKQ